MIKRSYKTVNIFYADCILSGIYKYYRMNKELLILTFSLILFCNHVSSQVWDHPFFEIDIPSTWRRMTPARDIKTPVRKTDSIQIYKDVRLTPLVDGGVFEVIIFESIKGYKLNYKDFFDYKTAGNVISEKFLKINNLTFHEREQITESHYKGETLHYYNTIWHIQGNKRVYRFRWGSFNKKVYNEELEFIKTMLESFTEKL